MHYPPSAPKGLGVDRGVVSDHSEQHRPARREILINGRATITDETKAEVIVAANNMPSVAGVVLKDSVNRRDRGALAKSEQSSYDCHGN